MAEPQKVWNKHKITAIVIMLIAIAFVFSMYIEWEYPAINHPKSLERPISNCINNIYGDESDIHAKVIQVDKHDNYLFVTFTDEKYPNFMGIARFQRGYDSLWHLDGVSYGNDLTVSRQHYYLENGIQTIIYGIDTDPRIAFYERTNYERKEIYTENITSSNFIHYYEDEIYPEDLNLYDKAGNNITLELKAEADDSGPEGGTYASWNGSANWIVYFILLFFTCILASIFWAGNRNPIRYSEIKEVHGKTISRRFVDRFKNLDKHKKRALAILIIAFVISIAIYSTFYSINPENNLIKSVEEASGDSNITLLKTEMVEKNLIVLYKTEKPYERGIVIFEEGWNGRMTSTACYKITDICITNIWSPFQFGGTYYYIVSGVDCDPRAVSYEYVYEYPDIDRETVTVYGRDISESNFLHIYKMENRYPSKLNIYDAAGNNIAPELIEEIRGKEIGNGSGASHGMLYEKAIPIFIIIIGFLAAWWLWIGNERQREG